MNKIKRLDKSLLYCLIWNQSEIKFDDGLWHVMISVKNIIK